MIAKLAEKKPFNWKVVAAIVAVFVVVAIGIYFLVKNSRKASESQRGDKVPEPVILTNPPQVKYDRPEGPPSLGSVMDMTFCHGGPCIR